MAGIHIVIEAVEACDGRDQCAMQTDMCHGLAGTQAELTRSLVACGSCSKGHADGDSKPCSNVKTGSKRFGWLTKLTARARADTESLPHCSQKALNIRHVRKQTVKVAQDAVTPRRICRGVYETNTDVLRDDAKCV